MSESTVNKIVVVGSGISVGMVAAMLSAQLGPRGIELVAVELNTDEPATRAEACGSEFWPLCELSGLNPQNLIAKAGGTFRLGSLYRSGDRRWFVPFGAYGLQASAAGFDAAMLKALRLTGKGSIEDYSLAASAALGGKFAIPGRERADLCNSLKAGVSLSVPHCRQYLTDVSRKRGVRFVKSGGVSEIERDEAGHIRRVTLATGERIEGDFWIDCSGDAALLRLDKKTVPVELPWDSVAYASREGPMDEMPADEYQRTSWGWRRKKSLQGSAQYELYYKHGEVDEATLADSLPGPAPRLTSRRLVLGASPTPWEANCLGVGSSVANLGELVFSDLALVQAGIVVWLDLYPVCADDCWGARHYNQQWSTHVREALEYTLLHSAVDSGVSPDTLCDGRLPEALTSKLAIFTRRGRIEEPESDAVSETQWLGMMYGIGLRPLGSPLHLEPIASEKVLRGVDTVGERIRTTVAGMPSHTEFVNKFFNASG